MINIQKKNYSCTFFTSQFNYSIIINMAIPINNNISTKLFTLHTNIHYFIQNGAPDDATKFACNATIASGSKHSTAHHSTAF